MKSILKTVAFMGIVGNAMLLGYLCGLETTNITFGRF